MAKNSVSDVLNNNSIDNEIRENVVNGSKKPRSRNVAKVSEGNVRHRFDISRENYTTLNNMSRALEVSQDTLVSMALTMLFAADDDMLDKMLADAYSAKLLKIKMLRQK